MNICFFSVVNYWQGINGGMEIHGKILCEGLVERGHDVTIISTNHPEGKEFEIQSGIKIFYLKNNLFLFKSTTTYYTIIIYTTPGNP